MTDSNYRHLELITDRSGSMGAVAEETEQGIAVFLADQAALPGRATVSLTQFDTHHDQVWTFKDIREAGGYHLVPRGGTALLDAIGYAFTRAGERLAAIPEVERPGEVVVMIATDGEENSSVEYTLSQVREMIIRQQEAYGWKVIYIGANQDAFKVGQAMGIGAATTLNYTPAATAGTYAAASAMVSRGTQTGTYGFTAGERTAAAGTNTSMRWIPGQGGT